MNLPIDKKMKNQKIIFILVAVLLIVGAAYYLWGGGLLSPEEVLMEAHRNTAELDSYTLDVEMETDILSAEGESLGNVSAAGSMDIDEIKKAGRGDIDIEYAAFSIGSSFVYVDDDFYGKINTMPITLVSLLGENLTDQWILVMEDVLETADDFLAEKMTEADMEPKTAGEMITEFKELEEAFLKKKAFTIEEVKTTQLNGVSVDRYKINYKADELMELYFEMDSYVYIVNELLELSEEDRKEVREEVEKYFEEVEVYVYTDGEYILRERTESVTDITQEVEEMMEAEGMEERAGQIPIKSAVSITVDYGNFNEKFIIEPPEEFMGREEAMEKIELSPLLTQ